MGLSTRARREIPKKFASDYAGAAKHTGAATVDDVFVRPYERRTSAEPVLPVVQAVVNPLDDFSSQGHGRHP
jgi:hypothetical protein